MTSSNTVIFDQLSHAELIEITDSALSRLLSVDELIKDIPSDTTTEEVMWMIAVEHGKSITLKILREDEEPLSVIVPQKGSTVLTLKKAIRRHFEINQKRKKMPTHNISWKYIWRIYGLQCNNEILTDDHTLLSDYGVDQYTCCNCSLTVMENVVIRCPLCMEVYEEPPAEDWLQFKICKSWWHEKCSNYEGEGEFKCDSCE